jgi:hypothetical protein
MAKLKDIAVVVGTYTVNGEEKYKWKTVGALIEGKGGKEYVMLDRTFNPAGVPDLEGRGGDQIVMSLFEPKEKDSYKKPTTDRKRQAANDYPEDDIPF